MLVMDARRRSVTRHLLTGGAALAFASVIGLACATAQVAYPGVIGGMPSGLSIGSANQAAALAAQQRMIPLPETPPPVAIPPVGNPLSQSTLPPYAGAAAPRDIMPCPPKAIGNQDADMCTVMIAKRRTRCTRLPARNRSRFAAGVSKQPPSEVRTRRARTALTSRLGESSSGEDASARIVTPRDSC